ncbi:MAG: hypothetical protein IPK35_17610 [Saprospiraceae bacterium]|jgi:tetratricopeptide (TPR) repeat protein|nr:hypothetical protein [Saprospiraceae bacterium]
MELIQALFKIKINLKESNTNYGKKLDAFEELLRQNPGISDVDVCFQLYGNKDKNTEFRVLKHRLEQKLQDDIFVASGSSKNFDNFSMRSLVADKNNLIITSLYKNGYQKEAVRLAEKNLAFCKENYLTESAIPLTNILMNFYGFVQPDNIIFFKMKEENLLLSEIYHAENIAMRYNATISNWYVLAKGGFNTEKIKEVNSMLEELKVLKEKHNSWKIHFTYFSTANFYYLLTGQFNLGLMVAREGIQSCDTMFTNDKMMRYRCIINVGLSYFHLKQYDAAAKEYKTALSIAPEGHRLWFEDALNYFTILLRGQFYNELFSLYKSRIDHKNLNKIPIVEEQWKIREAFIQFLLEAKILDRNKLDVAHINTFNSNKFLNSIAFYTKDKAGLHIQIIILKILFLLLKRKYDSIYALTETLNQYIYKYLNKKEAIRSFYFIKLLIKMAEVGFHPIRVKAHTKNIYAKMEALTFMTDEKSNMVEILPYEELWQIILRLLEKNIRN